MGECPPSIGSSLCLQTLHISSSQGQLRCQRIGWSLIIISQLQSGLRPLLQLCMGTSYIYICTYVIHFDEVLRREVLAERSGTPTIVMLSCIIIVVVVVVPKNASSGHHQQHRTHPHTIQIPQTGHFCNFVYLFGHSEAQQQHSHYIQIQFIAIHRFTRPMMMLMRYCPLSGCE